MATRFRIEIAPTGYRCLDAIKDERALRGIGDAIDALARDPLRAGKALHGPLGGLHSVRACRSRFRVIYRVDPEESLVSVLVVGQRKAGLEEDVYALAERLLRDFFGRRKG